MPNEILDPKFWSVNSLFKYRFAVPVYQRPYSWGSEQLDSLLNDIWDSYCEYKGLDEEGQQKHSFYVGNIIIHKKGFEYYDIIDGQQRITTFSILLLALYAHVYNFKDQDGFDANDRILIKIQQALWKLDQDEKPLRDKRVIELGSIDKEILINTFDEAFSNPTNLKNRVDQYEPKTPFENNVKSNFNRSYAFLASKFIDSSNKLRDLLQYANYILMKVYLIAIISEDSEVKTFSIFESLNSKGKKLEDIDLIKTKIFSNLDESDYASYLAKWGDLISKTGDYLYDYFVIYIKAYVKYYSGNITYKYFKGMDNELMSHFGKDKIAEAYKALIEDMVAKVEYFNALSSMEIMQGIVNKNKFKFYYCLYLRNKYEHPWPLFFRSICELKNEKLSQDDLINIFIETIKFSVIFLTITGKDSKDAISMFSSIFDGIYTNNKVDKDWVIYNINKKLAQAGIRTEDVLFNLCNADVYDKNKPLGAAILSAYESQFDEDNERISWDEAYAKYSAYGSSYSLDHIMVQTPDMNDPNLKYYNLSEHLKLKDGHDFPKELAHNGMAYDDFKSAVLHRAGNLRLKGQDGNASSGNTSDNEFKTFAKLNSRNNKICEFIVSNVFNVQSTSGEFEAEKYVSTKQKKIFGNFDFSMENISLRGTNPESITINGKTTRIDNLKDILTNIATYLFELDKDKMFELAKNNWQPRNRVFISNSASNLVRPFPIIEMQIYIETNFNAGDIVSYSCALLDEFNVSRQSVVIFIPEE